MLLFYPLTYKFLLDLSNPATLKNFDLLMETNSYQLEIPEITSAWPKKYTFPRPVIASRISIHPMESASPPHRVWEPPVSEFPGAGDIRLQLQLYGNVYGMVICIQSHDCHACVCSKLRLGRYVSHTRLHIFRCAGHAPYMYM